MVWVALDFVRLCWTRIAGHDPVRTGHSLPVSTWDPDPGSLDGFSLDPVRAALPWALSSLFFAAHVHLSTQQERRPRSYEAFGWAGGPYGGNIKSKDLGNTQTSDVASVALNLENWGKNLPNSLRLWL